MVEALHDLIVRCEVDNLLMSSHNVKEEDLPRIADNAFETMGGLFKVDPASFTREDVISILKKSYK